MTDSFSGARVLVVGASSGIGLAAAHSFATAGAQITLASRGGDKLARATEAVGHGALARPLDVLDDEAVAGFFADEPAFDHVVVSAAATKGGPVRSLPLADAYGSMQSKFWGAYRVARAARIAPGGSLTLVSGFLSRRPSLTSVLQGAINAAVESLARGLALELAPIRVNAVSPGLIDTPLHDRLDADTRKKFFDSTAARLPVRRVGEAHDVAHAILFLAANKFATGTIVVLDGGGSIA